MIKETLEKNLNEIEQKLSSYDGNMPQELAKDLPKLLEDLESNIFNVKNYELGEYIAPLYKEKNEKELEKLQSDFEIIKMFAEKMVSNPYFKLQESQINLAKDFVSRVKEYISEIKKHDESKEDLMKQKSKYEGIKETLENNKLPSYDDTLEIFKLFDNSSEELKEALLEFVKYASNTEAKEITEEDIKKSCEKLKNIIFDSTNVHENSKKDYTKEIDKRGKEVYKKIEERSAKDIKAVLELLKALGIIREFKPIDLCALALYATETSIREAYKNIIDLSEENKIEDLIGFFTELPGFWVDQPEEREGIKGRTGHTHGPQTGNVPSFKKYLRSNTKEKILKILDIAKKEGIPVSKTFLTAGKYYIIEKNIDIFNLYNITSENSSSYIVDKQQTSIDNLIECGILNPSKSLDTPGIDNYANINSSALVNFNANRVNKETGAGKINLILRNRNIAQRKNPEKCVEFEKLFKISKTGSVAIPQETKDLAKSIDIEQYLEENNLVSFESQTEKEKYSLLEREAMVNEYIEIDKRTLEDSFIKDLDENYKEDEYIYDINGNTVSRQKVLRLYQNLKNNEQFTDEEIKLFALAYNTHFDEETYKMLEQISGLKKGNARL